RLNTSSVLVSPLNGASPGTDSKQGSLAFSTKRPGYSFERPGRRAFRCITLRDASLVCSRRPIFRSVCPNLDKVPLFCVAQVVAQLAEGFALLKDADSTT